MGIFELIGNVYNATCVLAYVSAGLWMIAAVIRIIKYIRDRKKGK